MKKDGANCVSILRKLYLCFTEDQLREAEANLDAYLEVVLRIYERALEDPKASEALRRLFLERGKDSNPNAKD